MSNTLKSTTSLRRWMRIVSLSLAVVILAMLAFYRFWFLRLPDREPVNDPTTFISPANGLIAAVVEWDSTTLEWVKDGAAVQVMTTGIGRKGYLVAIEMNVMNVHYQRAPIASKVIAKEYTEGKFKNALVKANDFGLRLENERNSILFETEDGIKYKVVQVAGLLARRIVDFVSEGQSLEQGELIGLIKLGSQVGIILPDNVDILVKPGETVVEGLSEIARIKQSD